MTENSIPHLIPLKSFSSYGMVFFLFCVLTLNLCSLTVAKKHPVHPALLMLRQLLVSSFTPFRGRGKGCKWDVEQHKHQPRANSLLVFPLTPTAADCDSVLASAGSLSIQQQIGVSCKVPAFCSQEEAIPPIKTHLNPLAVDFYWICTLLDQQVLGIFFCEIPLIDKYRNRFGNTWKKSR